jgi:RHS repeat-associated protein
VDGQPSSTYLWGLDISGSLQGAGGVGGLLAVFPPSQPAQLPVYDGNGNVLAYVDSASTELTARLEYGPFGEPLRRTGSLVDDLVFGFSTKQLDDSGLYYYGFRFFDPDTGRWPSRDPIEEQGGYSLYAFVGNDGVNGWDYLGMAYGEHLTKDEAKALSCALKRWIKLGPLANVFLIGNSDRDLSIKFLNRYLAKTGHTFDFNLNKRAMKILKNDSNKKWADAQARKKITSLQSVPYLITGLKLGANEDLGSSVGRVNIGYKVSGATWNNEGTSRVSIQGTFKDERYEFKDTKMDHWKFTFSHLDKIGIGCCWKGGETINDKWMGDLETHGYAEGFDVKATWGAP